MNRVLRESRRGFHRAHVPELCSRVIVYANTGIVCGAIEICEQDKGVYGLGLPVESEALRVRTLRVWRFRAKACRVYLWFSVFQLEQHRVLMPLR